MNRASIRRWHTYIGLFIAPSVLFFAFTGALQLFSLHEGHGDYHPAPLIEKLRSVHKDQVFRPGEHHGPPDGAPPSGHEPPHGMGPDEPGDHDGPPAAAFLLKGFFLIVSVALGLSTLFGLWMGLTQTPRKLMGWSLVSAGAVIPVLLLSLG
jgi:hypothetical protein